MRLRWIWIMMTCAARGAAAAAASVSSGGVDQSRTALEYVERVRTSACTGGTEETLPVDFDTRAWAEYAEVAVRMANLLTKHVVRDRNNSLRTSQQFLFDLVRNNVDSDSLIFGSAIAVEEYLFPGFRTFCPYAFKKAGGGGVHAHDLSLNYNYLDQSTEWYAVLRARNWTYRAEVTTNVITYREGESFLNASRERQPMARLQDGHWTRPYYDCGGGDIWMVTYSAPIFGLEEERDRPVFVGIGTIDIELTQIDINQCDPDDDEAQNEAGDVGDGGSSGSVDVFRGTHQCPDTTKCKPVAGLGFVPAAYVCECRPGYYFPDTAAVHKAYNGSQVETYKAQREANDTNELPFKCFKCAPGCDTCFDDSPCLYSFNLLVRILLCVLAVCCFIAMVTASVLVHVYKEKRPIKSASPIFLHIMNAGGALMCCPMFIKFAEPDDLGIICSLEHWPRHIGFSFAYGALLIKTWRVSAIFKVKSAKKMNLTDKVLVQRFTVIPAVAALYLTAWTAISLSKPEWRVMNNTLKFKDCVLGYWNLGALIGEVAFLLWGAVLCFIVRKAPSLFNESKYITWSIYNNILLGSFLIIIRELIMVDYGPDILYIMDFCYIQITVTVMMCLLYVPKILAIRKGDDEKASVTGRTITQTQTIDTSGITELKDRGCQTQIAGVDKGLTTTLAVPSPASGAGGLKKNKVHPSECEVNA